MPQTPFLWEVEYNVTENITAARIQLPCHQSTTEHPILKRYALPIASVSSIVINYCGFLYILIYMGEGSNQWLPYQFKIAELFGAEVFFLPFSSSYLPNPTIQGPAQ